MKKNTLIALVTVACACLISLWSPPHAVSLTRPSWLQIRDKPYVWVDDYGAIADDGIDDTVAINKAIASASALAANGTTLVFGPGIYDVTSASGSYALSTITVNISGQGDEVSVIRNNGSGGCLITSGYYKTFRDFQVYGNASSGDGIDVGGSIEHGAAFIGENAYSRFVRVTSRNNGRHGFVHRRAWGTKYFDCKSMYNSGVGYYLYSAGGEDTGANAILFDGCEARWNGGSDPSATFATPKGGVRITDGACIRWQGGIIESNHPWGVVVTNETSYAARQISFDGVYMEGHPQAGTGGSFKLYGGGWAGVSVKNCWIDFGAPAGATSTCFDISHPTDIPQFIEENNFITDSGNLGTAVLASPTARLSGYPSGPMKSILVGDVAQTGIGCNSRIMKVATDTPFIITGTVYGKRDSDAVGFAMPFMAARSITTKTLAVATGSSLYDSVGGATTTARVNVLWFNNELNVRFEAFCYGWVVLDQGTGFGASPPATYTFFNDTYPNKCFRSGHASGIVWRLQ